MFKKNTKESSSSTDSKKGTIYDDFQMLINNMSVLEDIEIDKMSMEEHQKAIQFYTFVKSKRMIEDIVENKIKEQKDKIIESLRAQVVEMFKE